MGYKILAINPGSTSTKVALYDEERPLLDLTLRHTTEQIAAYADSAIFEKRTAYSISTREQLEEDVRFVRSHGYAINNQRFEQGMISIAVPVQRTKGAPADFAISISGPSTRIADRQDTIVQELFKTAGRISELL